MDPPTTEQHRGLAAVSRRRASVAGEDGGVLTTGDAGRTWTDISPPGEAGGVGTVLRLRR